MGGEGKGGEERGGRGGNPAMDYHPMQGEYRYSKLLHAKEIRISSGLIGHELA